MKLLSRPPVVPNIGTPIRVMDVKCEQDMTYMGSGMHRFSEVFMEVTLRITLDENAFRDIQKLQKRMDNMYKAKLLESE